MTAPDPEGGTRLNCTIISAAPDPEGGTRKLSFIFTRNI